MKLNVNAFALACGLAVGLGIFLLTLWVLYFEGPQYGITVIGRVYRGYTVSVPGSVVGFAWGFLSGLLFGAVFAGFYNWLSSRTTK